MLLFLKTLFAGTDHIDTIYYKLFTSPQNYGLVEIIILILAIIAARYWNARSIARIFWPAVFFWPLLAFPGQFLTIPLGITLTGTVTFRLLSSLSLREPAFFITARRRSTHWATFLIWGGFIAASLQAFNLQREAYYSLFLLFQDWGEYASNYLRLANVPHSWTDYLAVAGHWNPFPTIFMTGLLKLWPSPETIFAVNSLLIYSVIPLAFYLARALKLSQAQGATLALICFLNPTISNQPLA